MKFSKMAIGLFILSFGAFADGPCVSNDKDCTKEIVDISIGSEIKFSQDFTLPANTNVQQFYYEGNHSTVYCNLRFKRSERHERYVKAGGKLVITEIMNFEDNFGKGSDNVARIKFGNSASFTSLDCKTNIWSNNYQRYQRPSLKGEMSLAINSTLQLIAKESVEVEP